MGEGLVNMVAVNCLCWLMWCWHGTLRCSSQRGLGQLEQPTAPQAWAQLPKLPRTS